MRTFEEYVVESFNFRLGGSKNAGTAVTFRELKPGNRFYVYFVLKKTGKVADIPAPEIHKLKRMYDTNSPTNLKFFCLLSDVDGKEKDYNIKASDLDSTISVYEYRDLIRVTSTTELTNEEAEEIAKQSLEESVDFRLGGSSNKGDNTSGNKTFNDMKKNDKFYKYDIDVTKKTCRRIRCKFVEMYKEGFIYILSNMFQEIYSTFKAEGWKNSSAIAKKTKREGKYYVFSTTSFDKAELVDDLIRATSKRHDSYFILKEGVDFRLGGSKDKGKYVKIEEMKTFAELEPEDVFYIYLKESLYDQKGEKYKICRIEDGRFYRSLVYTESGSSFSIPNDELNSNVYLGSMFIVATTFEELQKAVKSHYHEDMTEDDVRDLTEVTNEAVDFRLGGSANKGEVDEKKFSELKPGDDVYFFKFADGNLEEEVSYKFKSTKSLRRGSSELAFDDPYTFLILTKEEMEESIQVSETGSIIDVTTTYKISAKEALEAAKQRLEESVDFRLGGSARKGIEDGKATALYYHELPSEDDWEIGAFKKSLEYIKEKMDLSEVTTEDVYDFYDTCKDVEFKWVNQAWKDADLEYEMKRGGCILRIAKLDGKRIEEIVNENKGGEDEIFIIAVLKYNK